MFVEGLLHFIFTYSFYGQEKYAHKIDIYAKDVDTAKWQFSTIMVNAPKYNIINIEIVNQNY